MQPQSSLSDFRHMIEKYAKHEGIMVVGHNPSITEFLARSVVRSGSGALLDFKKGAVACVESERQAARLKWFLTPRLARALQTADAENSNPKTSRK
jgi:phosphohistidine phosphatase